MTGKEINVTQYEVIGKLPDLLTFKDGRKVKTAEDWKERRKEVLEAADIQFGHMPPKPEFFKVERLDDDGAQSTFKIHAGKKDNYVSFLMYTFCPSGDGPFPVVVDGDMGFKYPFDRDFIHTFTDSGIMVVIFNRNELSQDLPGLSRSDRPLCRVYPDGDFGAMAAWAWGYSRCVDALEVLDKEKIHADFSNIAFTGHSRGGKTALLAGIHDERARIVNPNCSGEGGCAIHRCTMKAITEAGIEKRSETLKDIYMKFPFWFSEELGKYMDKEDELPYDAHFLNALVAPRILLDTEAASDIWANPIGTWQANMAAAEVFQLLDVEQNIIWRYRNGFHYHKTEDLQLLRSVMFSGSGCDSYRRECFSTPFAPVDRIEIKGR